MSSSLPPLRHAMMDYFASGGIFERLVLGVSIAKRDTIIKWLLQHTPEDYQGAIDDDARLDEVADLKTVQKAIRLAKAGGDAVAIFKEHIKPMIQEDDEPVCDYHYWQRPDEESDPDYNPLGESDGSSSEEEEESDESAESSDESAEISDEGEPDIIIIIDSDDEPPAKRRC